MHGVSSINMGKHSFLLQLHLPEKRTNKSVKGGEGVYKILYTLSDDINYGKLPEPSVSAGPRHRTLYRRTATWVQVPAISVRKHQS
jgi:hypothetical protein